MHQLRSVSSAMCPAPFTNGLTIVAESFNRLDSPTTIGPPSANNFALGCTTVLAPVARQEERHNSELRNNELIGAKGGQEAVQSH